MALTYKQRMFVAYYLGQSKGNATDAARRAGFAWPDRAGQRLVAKSGIRAEISAAVTTAAMSATEVLARISDIASGSLGEFVDVDPNAAYGWRLNLKRAEKRGKMHLLKKLKATKEGPEIEIHAPLDALKTLAQYHGLLKDKQEIDLKTNGSSPRIVLPAGRAGIPGQPAPPDPDAPEGATT